jgi:hypothetical protein
MLVGNIAKTYIETTLSRIDMLMTRITLKYQNAINTHLTRFRQLFNIMQTIVESYTSAVLELVLISSLGKIKHILSGDFIIFLNSKWWMTG